jgi:dihydrofolate reductase
MSRTVYFTACTLDGFLADPHDSLQWLFDVPASDVAAERFAPFLAGVGAILMGSATYLWILEHEQVLASPGKWQEWYGERDCVVMSSRDLPAVPGVRFARGDVRPVHASLVASAGGKDVWAAGGGELVGQLSDAGLLDELQVSVAPVTLGAGKPLLPRVLTSQELTLTDVVLEGQFVHLTYAVTRR